MRPVEYYIANATGELSKFEDAIERSFSKAVPILIEELQAEGINVVFLSRPDKVIPELGVGGYAPNSNFIYVCLDPESEKITSEVLFATLLHEIHHCIRWRNPGYGKSPGRGDDLRRHGLPL